MTLRRAFAIALLSATALAGFNAPARAEPISASIAAGIGLTAGTSAFGLTTAVLNAGFGMVANLGLSLFTGALSKRGASAVTGSQREVEIGGDQYRKIVIGRCFTRGRLIYEKGTKKSNKNYHAVIALSDWECDALTGFWIGAEKKALTPVATQGAEDARYTVGGYGEFFQIAFWRGAFPQTASSALITAAADTEGFTIGPWTSAMRGDGICYVHIHQHFDEDLFPAGPVREEMGFELRGAKLYDIRKDTTAGGSGTQRWDDPDTWAYSDNPAVAAYNFERGFWRNGQLLIGKGSAAYDLAESYYIAAMNVCDENITEGANSGKRYRCSLILSADAEHRVALDALGTAMAADWVDLNGVSGPIAGGSQAIAATITDDGLREDEPFTFTFDKADLYNAVSCRFINPALPDWQMDDLELLANPAWEAADGNRQIVKDVDLDAVSSKWQASRIQKIIAEQSRMQALTTGTFPPQYNVLQPGDWVTRNFNRHGLGTFTMKVVATQEREDDWVTLTLRQCAAANFTPPEGEPLVSEPPVLTPRTLTGAFVGVGFSAAIIESAGQQRPVLAVTWTAPDDPMVVAAQMQLRIKDVAGTTRELRHDSPEAPPSWVTDDVLGATTYEMRIRPVYGTGGVGTWSDWLETTTSSAYSVLVSKTAADTQALFGRLELEVNDGLLNSAAEALARYIGDREVAQRSSREVMEVHDETNLAMARVVHEQITRASQNAALAALLEAVTAQVGVLSAAAVFKMEAVAAPGGTYARIAAYVRATSGENYKEAGWFIDIIETEPGVFTSRIVFRADMFMLLTSSGAAIAPFSIVGEEVYINDVTVGSQIKSANYIADKSGFRLGSDGILRAEGALIGGGTSTKRPFTFAFGAYQDGVLSDEPSGSFDITKTMGVNNPASTGGNLSLTYRIYGSVQRTPTAVIYDITVVRGSIVADFRGAVSRGPGMPWAPAQLIVERNSATVNDSFNRTYAFTVYVTAAGEIRGVLSAFYNTSGAGPAISNQLLARCLNPADTDPLFLGTYNQSTVWVWKAVVTNGIRRIAVPKTVLVAGVPRAVTGFTAETWGCGGHRGDGGGNGGPTGYVKATHACEPGEMLSLLVGDSEGNGFGGVGMPHPYFNVSQTKGFRGAGATLLWRGAALRQNLLQVSGGGGMARQGYNGGPGGSPTSGGNGSSATDMRRCLGLSGLTNSYFGVPGGGGYEGGGSLGESSRGGKNYVHPAATNVTILSSAVDGNGRATTPNPPGMDSPTYAANKTDDRGRPDVGLGSGGYVTGGPGLLGLTWETA